MATSSQSVLVLGGYGLIGTACVMDLRKAGHQVSALGRNRAAMGSLPSDIRKHLYDMARMDSDAWHTVLDGVDVIVNAAGALQDGAKDDLTAIHETATKALADAAGDRLIVQISAAGAGPKAETEFLRSKGRGDAALLDSGARVIVLRPTLVIGPAAYGGTALLRAAAALPCVHPITFTTPIQTVSTQDLAASVRQCVEGEIAEGTLADLTAPDSHRFDALTETIRAWMGLPPWTIRVRLPRAGLALLGAGADALGWLGWRSPLRTTALRTLEIGVTGDASTWHAAGGHPCAPLAETLAAMPATPQDRSFARAFLMLPLIIGTLAIFWVASGLIGFWQSTAAQQILTERGISAAFAYGSVIGGAVADIALGLAVLVRPWARMARLGMVAVSAAYAMGSLWMTPDLWADPLGPLVKIAPAGMLALTGAALLPDR